MASELEGVADLTKALVALGAKVAAKELRGTVRAVMNIALDRAESAIPVGTVPHRTYKGRLVAPGFAQRNLTVVTTINKQNGSINAILGPKREAFYATQFVEVGTSKMAAKPWLRPAFAASKDEMLNEIGAQLKARLERIESK